MAIACFENILIDVGYNFNHRETHISISFLFLVKFCKFHLEKNDFDLCKGIFMKKMAQICRILKEKILKLIDFYDKF
jgi:hypothetical protein